MATLNLTIMMTLMLILLLLLVLPTFFIMIMSMSRSMTMAMTMIMTMMMMIIMMLTGLVLMALLLPLLVCAQLTKSTGGNDAVKRRQAAAARSPKRQMSLSRLLCTLLAVNTLGAHIVACDTKLAQQQQQQQEPATASTTILALMSNSEMTTRNDLINAASNAETKPIAAALTAQEKATAIISTTTTMLTTITTKKMIIPTMVTLKPNATKSSQIGLTTATATATNAQTTPTQTISRATATTTITIANAARKSVLIEAATAAAATASPTTTTSMHTETKTDDTGTMLSDMSNNAMEEDSALTATTFDDDDDVDGDGAAHAHAHADVDADADADGGVINEDENSVLLLPHPGADALTKGFSIPTFLPPFPVFAAADLPAYRAAAAAAEAAAAAAAAAAASTPTPGQMFNEQHLYLDAYNGNNEVQQQHHQQATKRNLTSPPVLNITVQMGNHAYMPCQIRRLSDKPVSWVRMRDEHIISVDETTFIADERFQAIYQEQHDYTWSLQIKYVQAADQGWYECQMATEPKMSAKVFLEVVTPKTELIGDQSRFVKAGSKVALHCIVRGTLDPPKYILWFRGKTKIPDIDDKTGWYTQIDRNIFGNVGDNQNTIGSLIIPFVRKEDSGNYTCQPSNSAAVSVDLHVLSGEYSASAIMSRAAQSAHCCLSTGLSTFLLLLILLLVALQKT